MKRVFVIFVGILLLVAIPVTVFVAVQRQELRKRAAPATTLSVSPASVSKKVGDLFTLELEMDTAQNQVVAAEIHLVYDPTKLEAQTITNGPLFPNVLVSGVIESGTASITIGATSATSPITGTGTAATVKFRALEVTAAPSPITFASNTFVGALGEGATNVLVGTTPASVTVTSNTDAQISPTAQPTQSGGPQASPTPSPSLQQTPLSPAPTPALQHTTISDTFNATALDTTKWKQVSNSSKTTVVQSNGALVTTNHEDTVSPAWGGLATVQEFAGDFQAQVTVQSLDVSPGATGTSDLQIYKDITVVSLGLVKTPTKQYVLLSTVASETAHSLLATPYDVGNVSSVSLKLTRSGSVAQALVDSGSGFVPVATLSGVYTGAGNLFIGSELLTHTTGNTIGKFDNFSASGNVYAATEQKTVQAIQVISPQNNTTTSTTPTIQGKAAPGATVTLTIYSEPVTATVTADANGNWSYTPTTSLDPGPHNVVASAQSATGETQSATTSFIVASAGESAASESATPVAGNPIPTVALIALGVFLLLAGARVSYILR